MPKPKKKAKSRPVPRPRNTHARQRQHLIDACISALHIYGPSRTTVEKVVAIAKMSPGIVRFYFASKAAMLVASLQFLATEFEEQLLVPVGRLKSTPVAALELMVDLYLDPEIASPRKVSVWYAFWGEASSRQEYYDICGHMDEGFAALVRELIEQLIVDSGQSHLDPDGVALGLMGCLEMLWQDFAFRSEKDIDRIGAKSRCMAYLRSVFPGQFEPSESTAAGRARAPGAARIAAWAYDSVRLLALERSLLFSGSWQLAGHRSQLRSEGDFIAPDLQVERPLILTQGGRLVAFRNSCTLAPHALTTAVSGNLKAIICDLHGVHFNLQGQWIGGRSAPDLKKLAVRTVDDLIVVRARHSERADADQDFWPDMRLAAGAMPSETTETLVSADWKLLMEQCLAWQPNASLLRSTWSARAYEHIVQSADFDWQWKFIAPNHLFESRPDGFTILQVLPVNPGCCRLRSYQYTFCADRRAARAAQYLASRLKPALRRSAVQMAESTQKGLLAFGFEPSPGLVETPQTAAFRRHLIERIPAMGSVRAPVADF
jgi:TetR/AcrR family transcriptional regulator, transcriptional repressor of bet genes